MHLDYADILMLIIVIAYPAVSVLTLS